MNNKEKIRARVGKSDSVNERSADSMAENIKNFLQGIRNSFRRLIRNVAFVTQLSAAAFGVIGCETSHEECFREKLFLNFDGQTIPCGDMRAYKNSVYNVHYYCDGKSDNENANIEAFVGSLGEKEKMIIAIRARFEPLGIEVFTDPEFSLDANILTIGGAGRFNDYSAGKANGVDIGNTVHNNSGYVINRRTDTAHTIGLPPKTIAVISIHEVLHMLGLIHPAVGGPESIMTRIIYAENWCLLTQDPDEAETLAKNLSGACNNQGVPFDVLKKAAELGSEEAIHTCLDL